MANLVYQNAETVITWLSSGGDNALTMTSVADGAGRQGGVHDFGVGARAREYVWRAWVQAQASPTLGAAIEVYAKTGDESSEMDNRDSTSDAAVTNSDFLRNLKLIGLIICDAALANTEFVASGTVWLPIRLFQPILWNELGSTLTTDPAEHSFQLTAVPSEVQ